MKSMKKKTFRPTIGHNADVSKIKNDHEEADIQDGYSATCEIESDLSSDRELISSSIQPELPNTGTNKATDVFTPNRNDTCVHDDDVHVEVSRDSDTGMRIEDSRHSKVGLIDQNRKNINAENASDRSSDISTSVQSTHLEGYEDHYKLVAAEVGLANENNSGTKSIDELQCGGKSNFKHISGTAEGNEQTGDSDKSDQLSLSAQLKRRRSSFGKFLSTISRKQSHSRKTLPNPKEYVADIYFWETKENKRCAKIYSPENLSANESPITDRGRSKYISQDWERLRDVNHMEFEDSGNNLDEFSKHICTEFKHLTSLSISWTRLKAIPPDIFSLPLISVCFTRNELKHLNGIERAQNLEELDISHNQLETLPKNFTKLYNLKTLNISCNELQELPWNLSELANLSYLDCSSNKLNNLPVSFGNTENLRSVDISRNSITQLPDSFGNLHSVEDIKAQHNYLSCLPKSFSNLTALHSLLLGKNQFTCIPKQLATLLSLRNLNMRENEIQTVTLPLPSLNSLILDCNGIQSIDEELLCCTALELLSLKHNSIKEIPDKIYQLQNIHALYLCGNAISEIPKSIALLSRLKHFAINSTRVVSLPQFLHSEMPQLSVLELEDCKLDQCVKLAYKKDGLIGIKRYYTNMEEERRDSNEVNGHKLLPFDRSSQQSDTSSEESDREVPQYPDKENHVTETELDPPNFNHRPVEDSKLSTSSDSGDFYDLKSSTALKRPVSTKSSLTSKSEVLSLSRQSVYPRQKI